MNEELSQKAEIMIKRLRERGKDVVPIHKNIEQCFMKVDDNDFFWFKENDSTGVVMIFD